MSCVTRSSALQAPTAGPSSTPVCISAPAASKGVPAALKGKAKEKQSKAAERARIAKTKIAAAEAKAADVCARAQTYAKVMAGDAALPNDELANIEEYYQSMAPIIDSDGNGDGSADEADNAASGKDAGEPSNAEEAEEDNDFVMAGAGDAQTTMAAREVSLAPTFNQHSDPAHKKAQDQHLQGHAKAQAEGKVVLAEFSPGTGSYLLQSRKIARKKTATGNAYPSPVDRDAWTMDVLHKTAHMSDYVSLEDVEHLNRLQADPARLARAMTVCLYGRGQELAQIAGACRTQIWGLITFGLIKDDIRDLLTSARQFNPNLYCQNNMFISIVAWFLFINKSKSDAQAYKVIMEAGKVNSAFCALIGAVLTHLLCETGSYIRSDFTDRASHDYFLILVWLEQFETQAPRWTAEWQSDLFAKACYIQEI
ncbi:hypothetical protein CYLTODRAFT_460295 [Cylindrobasidium torrendii FP15055 ss-10]|uniref:DUF6532 domain-containing protein n=1 Tax=Cylindrobasidium torrendii FP15055 ss-10 TaxID=1314674 RepID=A0A0D7ARS9_9AGAR|nr:hypothetical protein CYLTODRAFT_460295 [Cylindrobasidium torrendii FP15055 ss-10]